MVHEEKLDPDVLRQITWAKQKSKDKKVMCNKYDKFLDIGDSETYIAFEIDSVDEIPVESFKRFLITSDTLQFYDLYDKFEPLTEDFKIYNLGTTLVAEVDLK